MKRSNLYRLSHYATLALAALLTGCAHDKSTDVPESLDAVERIDAFIARAGIDRTAADWREHLPKPPQVEFDPSRQYHLQIETNKGLLTYQLLPSVAPMHVSSTIYLTRLGFYDGLTFHRVIPGFMAQGGDPRGNGRGGPGYTYAGEFSSSLKHDQRGRLSMANAGPGTDGSQFFLTFVPTPWLDGKHTIFGTLLGGDAVLDSLEAAGSQGGQPSEELRIEHFTIEVDDRPPRRDYEGARRDAP